jgi:hypothetical protein
MFIDRTNVSSLTKPLYKLLEIKNLGFYYKPNETKFISESKQNSLKLLEEMFTTG